MIANPFKDETYIKAGFVGVNCLLITLLAYISIELFYSVITKGHDDSFDGSIPIRESVRPNQPSPARQTATFSAYDAVNRRNLFNVTKPDAAPAADDVSNLELTDLSLTLHGTMVNRLGPSYAVLQDTGERGSKARLIMENESIGGAVLTAVYRDKVVLTVNGSRQVLMMETYRSRTTRYRSPAMKAGLNRKPIRQTRIVRKRDIDKAMGNMGAFLKQARISPHFTNGTADGFRITRIKPGSLFQKLGLRSGDIIMGVNGQEIRSADDAMAFYQDLSAGRTLSVQLRRRRRDRVITYRIR
ncbi:type II secretion system protein GspC [Desulfatiferula olefinivorans]